MPMYVSSALETSLEEVFSASTERYVLSLVFLLPISFQNFLVTGNEIGRTPPTFADASVAAKAILDSGFDFDEGAIIFNRFKTVVSYQTSKLPILPLEVCFVLLGSIRQTVLLNAYLFHIYENN